MMNAPRLHAGFLFGAFFLFFLPVKVASNPYTQQESKLFADLMKNYQKWGRPVVNATDRVAVRINVGFRALQEVVQPEGSAKLRTRLFMLWTDESLRWNNTEYFGIKMLVIPITLLWTPNVCFFSRIDGHKHFYNEQATVDNQGSVLYATDVSTTAICTSDFTYYPYDEQTCKLEISSWYGNQVQLKAVGGEIFTFAYKDLNSGWELMMDKQIPIINRPVKDGDSGESDLLTIEFKIKRKATFIKTVLVFSGIFLAFLSPFIFMFPPDAGEKTNLGICLIHGFLLLLVMWDRVTEGAMMTSPSPPLICQYYTVNIAIVGLSMAIAMIRVRIWSDRGRPRRLPAVVSTMIVDGFGSLICVIRQLYKRERRKKSIDAGSAEDVSDEIDDDELDPVLEWKLIGMILDRVLFVLFLVVNIFVAAVMLHSLLPILWTSRPKAGFSSHINVWLDSLFLPKEESPEN